MMVDRHGRRMTYLRLAVTDRCNLRCSYCMPEEGLDWLPGSELMTYAEMYRLCSLFVRSGIQKIRITGGEPFVRKGLLSFLGDISGLSGLTDLTITTNGLLTAPFAGELRKIGVKSVNISLDTLDEERFFRIAHRKGLPKVLETIYSLIRNGIRVKINAVVMGDKNIPDIIPLVRFAEKLPVSVRFIEEMPFNGGSHEVLSRWDFPGILGYIQGHFPGIKKAADAPGATSYNYEIPGFKGDVGIIAAYTRTFCGSCNRLRITPSGVLNTCLYEAGTLNLRDAIRSGSTDEQLEAMVKDAVLKKAKDGWEAQTVLSAKKLEHTSMAKIGG